MKAAVSASSSISRMRMAPPSAASIASSATNKKNGAGGHASDPAAALPGSDAASPKDRRGNAHSVLLALLRLGGGVGLGLLGLGLLGLGRGPLLAVAHLVVLHAGLLFLRRGGLRLARRVGRGRGGGGDGGARRHGEGEADQGQATVQHGSSSWNSGGVGWATGIHRRARLRPGGSRGDGANMKDRSCGR